MKKILLLILLAIISYTSHSQVSKRLKIGDKLPDLAYNDVWNYKTKKLRTSDFRGKLLILDFWSITCGACIKSMPKMENLQNKYSGKIQILMITRNSDSEVIQLGKRQRNVKENKLPFINGDTILSKLFYYETVPTHVWINESGKVIHITEGWDTNDSTITAYLNNKNPIITEKWENEELRGKNVLEEYENYARDLGIIQYSFFKPKIEGAHSNYFTVKDSAGGITDITFINKFPYFMFQFAFSEIPLNFYDSRRVELKGERSNNFRSPKIQSQRSDWRNKQMCCYRLKLPERLSTNALRYMQQDLIRNFNVNASVEKRKIKCLLLKSQPKNEKLYCKGGHDTICILMGDKFIMKNSPIFGLVNWLNNFSIGKSNIPLFFDGTNITQGVDLEIDGDVLVDFDIEGLRTKLARYGLTLVEGEQIIDMLVISDK